VHSLEPRRCPDKEFARAAQRAVRSLFVAVPRRLHAEVTELSPLIKRRSNRRPFLQVTGVLLVAGALVAGVVQGASAAKKPPIRFVVGFKGLAPIDQSLARWKSRPKGESRVGVSKSTIRLGQTIPQSGPLAAQSVFSQAEHDFFDRVNQAGGIYGRKINLISKDDAFDPSRSIQATQELIQQDKVFAIFNSVGTVPHAADFPYILQAKVPDLFVGTSALWTGYPARTNVYAGYPSVALEFLILTKDACAKTKGLRISVIYQNDSLGGAGLKGIQFAAKQSGCSVVNSVGFDPSTQDFTSVTQQAVTSSTQELMVVAFSPAQTGPILKVVRQTLGSKIPIAITSGSAVPATASIVGDNAMAGVRAARFHYGMADPSSQAVASIKALGAANNRQVNDTYVVGVMWAQAMMRALLVAGPDLTRQGLIQAMNNGFKKWECMVCLAPITYSASAHWSITAMQPAQWSPSLQNFVPAGKTVNFTGPGINSFIGDNPDLKSLVLAMKL